MIQSECLLLFSRCPRIFQCILKSVRTATLVLAVSVSFSSTRCFLVLDLPPDVDTDACFWNSDYAVYHRVFAFKMLVMWIQVPVVCLGRMRKSVQHLHRRVHSQPAGTHGPGDRCPDQPLQPPAGTVPTFSQKHSQSMCCAEALFLWTSRIVSIMWKYFMLVEKSPLVFICN